MIVLQLAIASSVQYPYSAAEKALIDHNMNAKRRREEYLKILAISSKMVKIIQILERFLNTIDSH